MQTLSNNELNEANIDWPVNMRRAIELACNVITATPNPRVGCVLVKDGVVATPQGQFVLEGITRDTVMDLARGLDMPVEQKDIDLFDAYTADEAFLTSTSLCICPVSAVNGTPIRDGKVPGPVTQRLMSAFSDLAGMDYVDQYLSHLS